MKKLIFLNIISKTLLITFFLLSIIVTEEAKFTNPLETEMSDGEKGNIIISKEEYTENNNNEENDIQDQEIKQFQENDQNNISEEKYIFTEVLDEEYFIGNEFDDGWRINEFSSSTNYYEDLEDSNELYLNNSLNEREEFIPNIPSSSTVPDYLFSNSGKDVVETPIKNIIIINSLNNEYLIDKTDNESYSSVNDGKSNLITDISSNYGRYSNSTIEKIKKRVNLDDRLLKINSTHYYCENNSTIISFEQINDDYCDCDNGADESGKQIIIFINHLNK